MKKILSSLFLLCFAAMVYGQSSNTTEASQKQLLIKKADIAEQLIDEEFIHYFEGTVYIDGKIKGTDDLNALKSDQIESINVYKGEAARKKFNITHNQGVIEVKTKKED